MRRSRGRGHSLKLASVLAAVLTVGSLAPAAFANLMLSLDGTAEGVVRTPDQTDSAGSPPDPDKPPKPQKPPKPKKPPKPTPTPTPEPTPAPTSTPTPTPTLTPHPTPTPTHDTTPEATAVTAPTEPSGPEATSPDESTVGEIARNGSTPELQDPENEGVDSWVDSMALILEELASTGDGPVRAAEGASLCPGAQCGSASDAIGSTALAGILICVLVVAGMVAIRVGRRRLR